MSNWRAVAIHFGKNKDMALGSLPDKNLKWYINEWQPKGWTDQQGNPRPPSDNDKRLRAALDEAKAEREVQQAAPRQNASPRGPQAQAGANLTFAQACILYRAAYEFADSITPPEVDSSAGAATIFIYCAGRGIMPAVQTYERAEEPAQQEPPEDNIDF